MEDVRTPGRDLRATAPFCPDHAGHGAVSHEDTSRIVNEAGVWLWRRTGWCITYACGCRLEFHGVPTLNQEHPIMLARGAEQPLDAADQSVDEPG